MIGTFRLIAFDEGGVAGPSENLRLVCESEGGGKVAIWGRDGSRHNIDVVLDAGVPCTVECDYTTQIPQWAREFGHTQWVSQNSSVQIVEQRKAEAQRP